MTYAAPGTNTPNNTKAIISAALGIGGWVLWGFNWIFGFFAGVFFPLIICVLPLWLVQIGVHIAAIPYGHIALGEIQRTGEEGAPFAWIGLIAGYLSIGLLVLSICALIAFIVFFGGMGIIAAFFAGME